MAIALDRALIAAAMISGAAAATASSDALVLASVAANIQPPVEVARGHAEIRSYARFPGTIVLGDDGVVAANITGDDVLVLTALAKGVTNVIVLDPNGVEMERFLLHVTEPGGDVAVRRAIVRELLRCDPLCRPLQEAEAAPRVTPTGGATVSSEAVVVAGQSD